jgi:hypothetical protein
MFLTFLVLEINYAAIMKKLRFVLLAFMFFSCEKEENFDVTQIISIRTLNQINIDCPGKIVTLDLAFDNKSYDEIHQIQREMTYSKWVSSNDTIWLLRNYMEYTGKIRNVYYVYPDSTLVESYVKTALPYHCPKYNSNLINK